MPKTQEARIEALEVRQEINSGVVDDITMTLHSLNEKVGKIEMKLEKSMSFIGGMAFTFSLLGALFTGLLTFILNKMGISF